MKKLILFLFFVFAGVRLYSQSMILDDYSQNYFTLKANAFHYLDSLHNVMGDSAFYSESGDYSAFKRWENYWESKVPDGDFQHYFSLIDNYYNHSSEKSFTQTHSSNWEEIGPMDIPTGDMTVNTSSSGIGPVKFIRFYKNDTTHLLCGSTSEG